LIAFKDSVPGVNIGKYPRVHQVFDALADQPVATLPIKPLYTMCKQNKDSNDPLELDFDPVPPLKLRAQLEGLSTPIDYTGAQQDGFLIVQSVYMLEALSYFSATRSTEVELRFNCEKQMLGLGTPGKAFAVIMGLKKK
jgi:hypothetical protein